MLPWKPTAFINHIMSRSHDDRFPIPLWETWFCSSLGVPIPSLLPNPRQCPCRQFSFDPYGDHIQTCQRQSAALPAHAWIVYKLSLLLRSVTSWECMQYMQSAPTSSEFMELYPFHGLLNDINAYIAAHESRKTELQARRVDVLRNLAHLHPDLAGGGSPSPDLAHPHHGPPDEGSPSNKRKLVDMQTLLRLNATGSV